MYIIFSHIFNCTLFFTRIFKCILCFTRIFNCTLFFTHIFKCTLCFAVSKPEQCLCCWQLCPFSSMAASFGKLSMPRLSQSCFLVSPKVTPDLKSYFGFITFLSIQSLGLIVCSETHNIILQLITNISLAMMLDVNTN